MVNSNVIRSGALKRIKGGGVKFAALVALALVMIATFTASPAMAQTSAPLAPVVTLTSGNTNLVTTWTVDDNGDALTNHRVQYQLAGNTDPANWTTVNTHSGNKTYTISGLTNDQEYEVRVKARNSVGFSEWSEYATATPTATQAPPPSPPVVTLTSGNRKILATWTVDDNGADITRYRLLYQPDGGAEVRKNLPLNELDSPTSYTLTGLTNGTAYEIKLKAGSATNFSDWSESVRATPMGEAPGKPSWQLGQNRPTKASPSPATT